MDLFFVISGFLITGILFDSLERSDYFSNFYIRRSLRIFPLYYAVWIALLCLTPFVHILWNRYDFSHMAYLGNFFMAGGQLGHHANINVLQFQKHSGGPISLISIGHLWSLAVEEQFYLVWPAVIWFVRSRKKLLWICGIVIVLEPVVRTLYMLWKPYMLHAEGLYAPTYFRADTLLVGAALALWLRGSNPSLAVLRKASFTLLFVPLVVLASALWLETNHGSHLIEDPVVTTLGLTLIALSSLGLLMMTLNSESWVSRGLRHPTLTGIGRISYGMYLFHGFVLGYTVAKGQFFHRYHLGFLAPITGAVVSTGLAYLSFRFFESPFLSLKSRFAPRHGAADEPPPYLAPQHTEA